MPRGDINRALFRAMIPAWVRMGFSGRRMIREFRGMGFKIGNEQAFKEIREIRGMIVNEARVRALKPETLFPISHMAETELPKPRRYKVIADVEYVSMTTGRTEVKTVSFYSDTRKTVEEWADEFMEHLEEFEYRADFGVNWVSIRAVQHNVGFPY